MSTNIDETPADRRAHYAAMAVEPFAVIRAVLTPEEWQGFLKGNAIKYGMRQGRKAGTDDAAKALDYIALVEGKPRPAEPLAFPEIEPEQEQRIPPEWAPDAAADPHAELRKTWRPGQRWQCLSPHGLGWRDMSAQPLWSPVRQYRRHPEDAA